MGDSDLTCVHALQQKICMVVVGQTAVHMHGLIPMYINIPVCLAQLDLYLYGSCRSNCSTYAWPDSNVHQYTFLYGSISCIFLNIVNLALHIDLCHD